MFNLPSSPSLTYFIFVSLSSGFIVIVTHSAHLILSSLLLSLPQTPVAATLYSTPVAANTLPSIQTPLSSNIRSLSTEIGGLTHDIIDTISIGKIQAKMKRTSAAFASPDPLPFIIRYLFETPLIFFLSFYR